MIQSIVVLQGDARSTMAVFEGISAPAAVRHE